MLQRAAGDIDKVTNAHEKGTATERKRADATKATAVAMEDARKRFEAYTKEIEHGNRSTDNAVKQLKSFQREFDRLGNRVKAGTDMSDALYELGQRAQEASARIKKAQDDEARAVATRARLAEQQAAKRAGQHKTLLDEINGELEADKRRSKEFDTSIKREEGAYRRRILVIQQGREATEKANAAQTMSTAEASRQQAAALVERARQEKLVQAEIARTVRAMNRARTDTERQGHEVKLLDLSNDLRELGAAEHEVHAIMDRIKGEVEGRQQPARQGFFARMLGIGAGDVEAINKELENFEKRVTSNSFSASRFAGNLRAVVIVGLIGFFQQLVGAGVALGGTLVSLAAAAIQAGAALGGALVAGAAQAIPVVGLLAAAWGRIGAVFKTVQQAIKARMATQYDEATQADRQRSAADAVRSAQEALANAQRQATVAQENLTKARADAVRQIEDLVYAEKQAQLQAESARLAQESAVKTFRQSLTTGNIDQLASQALQVRQGSLDVARTGVGAARATFDATRATRGGVEGMDNVIQARRAVADAARGIADARRQLAGAAQQSAETIKQLGTADRLLKQMLADLSPAERRLYQVLYRVEKEYRRVFTGPGGVLESITNAFTYGAKRIEALLHNRRFISAAKGLSDAIGGQLQRLFRFLTGRRQIAFLEDMAREAKQNLPTVVSFLEHLVRLFEHIARAGAPAFRAFLNFLDGAAGKADKATGSRSGISRMERFFSKGEKYAESIFKMTYALARLFGAIMGAGASETGGNAFDAITRSLDRATTWINHHRGDVRQFFKDALQATGYIMRALGAVATALFGLFRKKQVEEFADAFRLTLLPAIENILKAMGLIAGIFLKIASNPFGAVIAQLALTAVGLRLLFGPIVKLFGNFIVFLGTILGRLGLVKSGLKVLEFASGPLKIFSVLAAALLILTGRIHSFGDAVQKLVPIVATLVAVMAMRGGLGGAITGLSGLLGKVGLGGLGKRLAARAGAKTVAKDISGEVIDYSTVGVAGKEAETATKAGGKLGGLLSTGMKTALKKAAWVGVGISAVEGIVSGFKHHSALAGMQDFMHSVSFGLFDSFEESARKAANRMAKTIHDRLARPGVIPTIDPQAPADSTRPGRRPRALTLDEILGPQRHEVHAPPSGGRGAGVNPAYVRGRPTIPQDTQLGEDIQKLREKYGKSFDTFLNGLRDRVNTFRDLMARKDVTGLKNWLADFHQFQKDAPAELQPALDGLVTSAEKATDAIGNAFHNVVRDITSNWKLLASQTKVHLQDIKDHVKANMGIIKLRLGSDSEEGRKAMSKNFRDAATAVKRAMDDGTISTKTGTREIRRLLVKSLTTLGLTEEQAINKLDHGTLAQTGDLAAGVPRMPGATGGYASPGGFLKGMGHRGRDAIRAVLAPGEAVLNWAHQRLVEPAMRAMYGFGLDGLFKRTEARHGAEGDGGMAAGGFVARPGTDFSEGDEPKIAAALRKLGQIMHTTIYGISGYRSPQHSVSVGGAANDPHTRGEAADIGVGSASRASAGVLTAALLRRVGLYRPFYPGSAAEINHVQLIGGRVLDVVTSAADAAYRAFKGPHLEGRGGIAAIINRGLHQVTRAANIRGRQIAEALGIDGGAFSTSARGTGRALMQRIARERGWSFGDWWKVDARETGHGTNLTNPHSSARLRGQFLSMNYGKYGPGSDPSANPSMRQQIISMARYIASRYGNPTKAWAHEQSAGWYEQGGSVGGKGAVPAVLHGGEHVWTAAEVMRAGGHQVMYALRKLLGGGKQAAEMAFAPGGQVPRIVSTSLQPTGTRLSTYAEPLIHSLNLSGVLEQVNAVQKVISSLRGNVVNKKFTDALSKSVQALVGEGGLLDEMDAAVQRLTTRLDVSLKRATYRITKTGDVVRHLGDVAIADRTLDNLRRVYAGLHDEQANIQQSLGDVARKLHQGGLSKEQRAFLIGLRRELQKRLDTVRSSIADNIESQFTAIENQISARVDRVDTRAQRRGAGIDIFSRVRALIGGTALTAMGGHPSDLSNMRVGVINDQIAGLQKAADFAGAHGHKKAQQDILDRIADLRVQALEAVAQGIQDDAEEIDRQASRGQAAQDLRGRLADLMDAAGNKQGAFATRGDILQKRAGIIGGQITGLQGLADQATATGNTALAEKLNDEIADLNVQLAENTAAQKENTIAARQAAIDAITARQSFQGGVLGGIQGLLQQFGSTTSTDTTGQQAGLLRQGISLLQDTGGQLVTKLLENYGIDIRGKGPADLARALSALNYDGIETNMSDTDKAQFEGLINSIIENATAVQQNTQQLNELTNPTSQNWSSTAWQWFRNAIFTGSGGLLTKYPVPSLAGGASILSDGMVHVHAGERVVAANVARGGESGDVFAPTIVNEERTVDMDEETLSNKLLFRWQNRPRG